MNKRKIKTAYFALSVLLVTISLGTTQGQTLSQEPLLTKTVSVRPNLTFILDDSGSMAWECIYTKNTQTSFGGIGYGAAYNCRNDTDEDFSDENVATLSSSDFRYTSPENNKLMYDPRVYYPTGISETGSPYPNSTASWDDIRNRTFSIGGTSYKARAIYLAKNASLLSSTSASTLNNAAQYNAYFILDSGSRFAVRTSGSGNPTSTTTTNPLGTKSVARTDCAGTVCTHAEELKNLRNWYTYHRTRIQAARVGVTTAFSALPDSFRMNYGSLTDIINAKANNNPIRAVNNYASNINPFRKWMQDTNPNNSIGTPLRQALDIVGQSYTLTSNSGPWGNTPWSPGSESSSSQVSCRRNFAILTTDGQWNNGGTTAQGISITNSSNDSDGTNGSLITHQNSTLAKPITFQFLKQCNNTSPPTSCDPRGVGKSDKTSGAGYNNTLADVAHYYWSRDLRTNLVNNVTDGKPTSPPFWQNMTTYSIAFGVNGSLTETQINSAKSGGVNWPQPVANTATAIDDLVHAAHNGGGEFLAVNDSADFSYALRKILLSITGETSSQAGVAASTTALQNGTNKYVPFYITGEWWGNLKSVNLDSQTANETTIKWEVISTDSNGKPTGTTTIPSPTTRNVLVSTNNSSKGVEFKYANLNPNSLIAPSATPVSNKLVNTFSSDQVDFIRGDRSKEGAGNPFRERQAILGDIVNARPAFVKNNTDPYSKYFSLPAAQGGGTLYTAYKDLKAARTEGVLFVGANDGMLHGFRESTGAEEVAIIPRSVLGNLHLLTEKNYPLYHRFFVDGPLKEADAYIEAPNIASGTSIRWTNLLMGSTGAGAKAVFAVDVTRPFNIQGKHILWEVSNTSSGFTELGHVLSDIETGVTPSGDWVAAFGNGYDSASGKASLFLVNLSTGAKIRELTAGTATGNGLGGVRLVHNPAGQVIGAYAGDLKGNLWRFDLMGNSASDWKDGQLLFTAVNGSGVAQAITAAPAVFARNDGKPGYIVVASTGRLLTTADTTLTPTPPIQSVYGLWDESPFGILTTINTISGRNVLVSSASVKDSPTSNFYTITSSRPINWATDKGWYMDLTDLPGQKTVYPVNALKAVVSIETIAPKAVTGSCTVDGEVRAVNYVLDPYAGMCKSAVRTLDTNGDNAIDAQDTYSCAYSSLGDGTNTYLGKNVPTEQNDEDTLDGTSGPPGGDPCLVYSIGSTGQAQLINICGSTPPPPAPTSNTSFSRDVRQVFIRQ